ncbi:hypothetical protein [Streptomyces sp. SP18BB07]|uniref:hypothetical protein n=1 Tax=Streptomyces sp. SP18BB07 TaxID=3002522 RepID=UPI002E76CD2A|nr:hypothetical protein [Streptomyces sp. SP18BB07]MEE1765258.1 hypothetical protein [Streptomyces sp. SP18BB07]
MKETAPSTPPGGRWLVKSEGSDGLLVHGNPCAEHVGMIERDHTPNAGTGLPGAHFSRRNRQAPTEDHAGSGRWIAIDESGCDGDQLHRGGRYMTLGSVAIDDGEAAAIVELLREEARIQNSAPEAKFQKMFTGGGSRPEPPDPRRTAGTRRPPARPRLRVCDRQALLRRGHTHQHPARGTVPRHGPRHRQQRRGPAVRTGPGHEAPRALGRDGFDRLIAIAVRFFAKKNRTGDHVAVDDLCTVLQQS